jgi:glutamyl-Q tRNA(Asp) synthetase
VAFVTRFAPSPTGPLHLGHAYSAMLAHDMAMREGGKFLLRIEDIDQSRCRPKWEQQIYDDLEWLGLTWETPVMRQSENRSAYTAALATLAAMDLTYPCNCQRADIRAALSAPQESVQQLGPDGMIYPGTCRDEPPNEVKPGATIRLNMARAMAAIDGEFTYWERGGESRIRGTHTADMIASVGDIVLSRQNMGTSYHLAVVVDATFIHVVLQELLEVRTPFYHHHRLIRDANGKRLAKRDDARSIATYRADGATPADIRRMVGL